MVAIGVALVWAGYAVGIWGYCLTQGYAVTFPQLFASTWPGTQVSMTAPSGGHKLGTITGNAEVTDPGQLAAGLG